MKQFDVEERVQKAIENFCTGSNCAQAVFLAYADLFDINEALARNLSVGFGGGVGRMREVCGTMSAMTLLAGLQKPVSNEASQEEKAANYSLVQDMANEFKTQHNSIICRELLSSLKNISTIPVPDDRTKEYYKVRPCVRYVETAARISGNMLKNKSD